MRLPTIAAGVFACLVTNVVATALTYKLEAGEKACFYAETNKENEKIAFYFAVQSGGSFDIDYRVEGPDSKIILEGEKERQGDFVFSAQKTGEYSFCFDNEMSTFTEKMIDIEISSEHEARTAQLPSKQGTSPEQTSVLEESIFKISGQLSTISRNQKYFRTRENRNFSTVNSTEKRIVNFSVIQICLIVCMGALQVLVVRFFFQGARKGYDLIPLRQRADAGEIDLARPDKETVAATTEKTKNALTALISGAVAAQKPKNINVGQRKEATFVRYTPANQMGDNSKKQDRIIKIVERQRDPMEPPKFKHKKIPRGPPSPPPPVMRSPPRKLTAEDQEMWRIPPPVSNWKNPKGFTVPLDKRLAADGRGLHDVTINDKHAQFAEAVKMAERHAREVQQRALMQQRLAEQEKARKDDSLRALALKTREERLAQSSTPRASEESDSEDAEIRERERPDASGARKKSANCGRTEWAQSGGSRGFDSGFNEDNHYDKPLFAAQDAISSIYRPRANVNDDSFDDDAGDKEMAKIHKISRFGEALGKGPFEARPMPRQTVGTRRTRSVRKEAADPFNVDKFLSEVDQSTSSKRGYGLQADGGGGGRQAKRARVDDDDDEGGGGGE
ncbi:Pre-mRNA-processing protein 45 [Ophiocordyceps camponoti-floridani]|uniref:Pre-mRNA-processing protein 45 n=1 Tax=Ophiocordyceps camponoti-floridani TaxID=2030778 RepID=A0A8H4Q081_9HYPO|nr:Pre-mRNA-processing protein 45 [Ophiocordyceps camponoti-floridani]